MKTKSFLTLLSFCLLFLLPLSLCAQEPVCGKCLKKKSNCPYRCNHPTCKTCGKVCGAKNNACPYGGKHPKCSVCGKLKENCAYKGNHPKCPTCGELKESCPYRGNHPLCAICGKVMEDCQYGGNHPKCPDCGKLIERCDYGGDHPKCNTCGELKENCPYRGDHPKDRGTHAGREWVDLGLSVMWATCNVGANTPEEYGNYYAWGETSSKSSYDEDNCKTYERSMSDIRGNSSYDAARANWGSNWRLPTDSEFEELIDNCDYQWTTQNGVKGVRFTSKRNGNSIFFSAAGWRYGSSTLEAGENGIYWSSTPDESYTQNAYRLCFDSGGIDGADWGSRYDGYQVRPVFAPKPAPAKAKAAEAPKAGTIRTEGMFQRTVDPILGTYNGHESVDLGLSVKWATCNVGANTPEEYGNYYAWGETNTKSRYDEDSCKTYDRSMSDIRGNSSYDAARANWGGSWRLPTIAEYDELVNNCTRQWTTQDGVAGMRFTSKRNGNSIFLPAAGYRRGSSTYLAGECGSFWSSTPYESNTQRAYRLYFDSGGSARTDWIYRYCGRTVRPVVE